MPCLRYSALHFALCAGEDSGGFAVAVAVAVVAAAASEAPAIVVGAIGVVRAAGASSRRGNPACEVE